MKDSNPYHTTMSAGEARGESCNIYGRIGLMLSGLGVASALSVGSFGRWLSHIAMYLSFLSLLGLAVSVVGLLHRPRRIAGWGVVIGLFGSLFLANFAYALFLSPNR